MALLASISGVPGTAFQGHMSRLLSSSWKGFPGGSWILAGGSRIEVEVSAVVLRRSARENENRDMGLSRDN